MIDPKKTITNAESLLREIDNSFQPDSFDSLDSLMEKVGDYFGKLDEARKNLLQIMLEAKEGSALRMEASSTLGKVTVEFHNMSRELSFDHQEPPIEKVLDTLKLASTSAQPTRRSYKQQKQKQPSNKFDPRNLNMVPKPSGRPHKVPSSPSLSSGSYTGDNSPTGSESTAV